MTYYRRRYYRKRESAPIDILFEAIFSLIVLLGNLLGELIFRIFKFIFDRRDKIKGVFTLKSNVVVPDNITVGSENITTVPGIINKPENIVVKKHNYSLKDSQITASENNFLSVLQEVVGNEYIISTQVPISSIVSVNNSDYSYFNKIKAKTIDYVLFTKERKPYLAIELDDRSHFRWDRRRRDEFVNNLMKEVGLRLLRVRASYSYDENYLKNQISG